MRQLLQRLCECVVRVCGLCELSAGGRAAAHVPGHSLHIPMHRQISRDKLNRYSA
jgi:hypothetical protein